MVPAVFMEYRGILIFQGEIEEGSGGGATRNVDSGPGPEVSTAPLGNPLLSTGGGKGTPSGNPDSRESR